LLLAGNAWAQNSEPERYLEVRGASELDMEPLPRATAKLYEGSNLVKTIQTNADGSFSFRLEINKQYEIVLEKDGLISKKIAFNTQMPDDEKGTWMNEFSMGLVKPCSGVDYSVLKEAVDRVSFDAKRREFISDKDYVNRMRPRIESLLMKNDQCQLDKYEETVKKADQLVSQNRYQEAIATYQEALVIYPREVYPTKKIAELNSQLNKQENSVELYKKVVAEADALMAQQKFAEALQKYRTASNLNPQETYPKQKASEIETAMAQKQAEQKAVQTSEDRYNQAMAKASVAYTRKDYATAKQYYQEALNMKPSESLPKSRVSEIETIEAKKAAEDASRAAEATRKAAFENDYKALISEADEYYKTKRFDEAKAAYAKALAMKPADPYPMQRVKAIENTIVAEQTAVQKKNDATYNEAIAAGNLALTKNQFTLAKESFRKALTVKPDDLIAKNKLVETDRLSEDYSKQKSVEEQFSKVVQTADTYFAAKDYQKAKESYIQALALKPGDTFTQTRIKAIDNLVAVEQVARQKSVNDNYNAAFSAGNNAIAENQYALAKESFQKALTFKPNDPSAIARLNEVDRLAEAYTRRQSVEEQYKKVVQTADGLYASKDLPGAKQAYQQAIALKPGDSYAQTKITAIDNAVAAEQAARIKATEDGYKSAIGAANTAISQQSYEQARGFLQKAISIKPGDAYATGKIAEIDRLIQEKQKRLEQEKLLATQYGEAIAAADRFFNARDYSSAKSSYSRALQLKPGDTYASQKIVSIDNLLAAEAAQKLQEIEGSYKNAMDRGTNFMVTRNYQSAKDAFLQALTIKPGDGSARQKLSEAELLLKQEQDRLAAEKAKKQKYEEAIRAADQFFTQKNFAYAKTSYEQAIGLIPAEAYPRQKLEETVKAIAEQERILLEQKAKELSYNQALANADKFFRAKDYVQARDEYSRALTLKPNETFPKTRVAEMENLIRIRQKEQEDAKARTDAYSAAIKAGNESFGSKNYTQARVSYAEALKYLPGDLLAADQIKKIDYLLSEAEKVRKAEEQKKAAYEALISSANKLFEAGNYPSAKEEYKKALAVDPGSAFAKQRIARIDEISRALSQAASKSNTQSSAGTQKAQNTATLSDLSFKSESERQLYLDGLLKKYPPGITLEKYNEQYREVYRYIIIRDNKAQEFRHIKYKTYSGAQYSMNGKPITQQYFLSQVKQRAGESFTETDM
jgi:Flp pilus assembly protein TadD